MDLVSRWESNNEGGIIISHSRAGAGWAFVLAAQFLGGYGVDPEGYCHLCGNRDFSVCVGGMVEHGLLLDTGAGAHLVPMVVFELPTNWPEAHILNQQMGQR